MGSTQMISSPRVGVNSPERTVTRSSIKQVIEVDGLRVDRVRDCMRSLAGAKARLGSLYVTSHRLPIYPKDDRRCLIVLAKRDKLHALTLAAWQHNSRSLFSRAGKLAGGFVRVKGVPSGKMDSVTLNVPLIGNERTRCNVPARTMQRDCHTVQKTMAGGIIQNSDLIRFKAFSEIAVLPEKRMRKISPNDENGVSPKILRCSVPIHPGLWVVV